MFFFLPVLALPRLVLLLAALVPPILLLVFVYRQDKIEREPPRLVAKIFLFGALSVIAAGFIEAILQGILGAIVPSGTLLYNLLLYFLVVGLTEEAVKHFALRKGSWFAPEFNYRFDAIVYAVAAALGFAAAENVGYVFAYGLGNALVRAVTSIPGHCCFGIFMGVFYGVAKEAADLGKIREAKHFQRMSILVPMVLHGIYDFCATSGSNLLVLVFFVFIILMDIFAYLSVRSISRNDRRI